MQFKNLMSPIKLGSVLIRNRVVFPPIDLGLHTEGMVVDPRYEEFLCALAENEGTGLIISEFTSVANESFWVPASRIYSDDFIPGFRRLVSSVHSLGAKIFMQLGMLGGRAPKGRRIAPSAIRSPLYPDLPEELSKDEIQWLISKWVEASVRAKKIGFDGVEVHGGHSYLVGEFMSPHTNKREDEYGGDLEGRLRFPVEIIKGIKKACGKDYTVGIKFSAYEALDEGITPSAAVDIAKCLENAGVDYLHVSSSTYMLGGTRYPDVPPMFVNQGPLVELAGLIKKHTSTPVIAVAGITTPEFAESVIKEGKADLVAVGRAMFADLGWTAKAREGRLTEITPCIRCNVCHKKIVIDRAGGVECTVNPGLLRKTEGPVKKRRRVLIVGAGPAGVEAALQASSRGHEVLLYEKSGVTGGNMRLGCIPPFKKDLKRLIEFYDRRLEKSKVRLLTENTLTPSKAYEAGADVVVVAVGGEEFIPEIRGIWDGSVVTARAFYGNESMQTEGPGKVAIIGAGTVGCELAWYLSILGKKVFIFDLLPYDEWMSGDHPTNRFTLLENLSAHQVQIFDRAKIIEVGEGGKNLTVARENIEYRIRVDLILLATGYRKSSSFAEALRKFKGEKKFPEIYEIGDCAGVRDIHHAIHEGYEVGITI